MVELAGAMVRLELDAGDAIRAEKAARAEALRAIEVGVVRAKFPWPKGMRAIGDFGAALDSDCRDMLYAGLAWLQVHPGEMPAPATLHDVVAAVSPSSSGAMRGAVMGDAYFIAKRGWPAYVLVMSLEVR